MADILEKGTKIKITRSIKYICIIILLILCVVVKTLQAQVNEDVNTPFENMLPVLERPEAIKPAKIDDKKAIGNSQSGTGSNNTLQSDQPGKAFVLVVTKSRYTDIKPSKDIYGIISLKITPDYMATSRVVFARKKYRFDRLSWAIKTGWNETIPFFSRMTAFKKYLRPFNTPVYAHFHVKGVQEYEEYPGQYYHWPREDLEEYYLYILKEIDAVASQN